MKKIILTGLLGVCLAISTSATTSVSHEDVKRPRGAIDLRTQMPKASGSAENRVCGKPSADFENKYARKNAKESKTEISREAEINLKRLPTADASGLLDSPTMTTWYYTVNYDKETIKHEYYTQVNIQGYEVTVYNEKLEALGTIKDSITLGEGETRVASVDVGPQVTKNFFNTDDKYEIMIAVATNTDAFVNNYRTYAYTLNNNTPVQTIPGIYISAINSASDNWTERFWITFADERDTETPEVGGQPNAVDYVYSTYKFATSAGFGEPVLVNRLPVLCMPGEDAISFLATAKDGIPYFLFNRLKYSWYLEPFNWEVETPTPNNELQVEIYSLPTRYATQPELYSTSIIPLHATDDDRYFLMMGTFSYNDDLAIDTYSESPALIVTKATWTNAVDEYVYDYDVYGAAPKGETAEASYLLNIGKNTSGGIFMADIPDHDPQIMFIDMTGSEPEFNFVDILTGEIQHQLPYRITDGVYMTTQTERVASGESYLYVASQTRGYSNDEGDMFHQVAYVNPDGYLDHIDTLNLGKNVDYAQVYVAYDAFNPFIFNLDDNREYMVLVKRRYDASTVGNYEELLVVSGSGRKEPLLTVGPNEETGILSGIILTNLNTEQAKLYVLFVNDEDMLTATTYSLPLELYSEGDGSIENPYIITSAGGLEQIKSKPAAHYALGCDFDATGYPLFLSDYEFTGTFDGRNHIISNLTLEGYSLFPNVRGEMAGGSRTMGLIKDVNFVNPQFKTTRDKQGLLVGTINGGTVENVHAYGVKMQSTQVLGGLVGIAVLNSSISGCSVEGTLTSDESVAGIVGKMRTGSHIEACAFSGSLTADSEIGGIAGTADNADTRIENCNVNATIKGANTIGGIVGESSRAKVMNCHVGGSIEATTPSKWGGGLSTGGIIGYMDAWYPSEAEPDQSPIPIVSGNVVTLSSLKGEEPTTEDKWAGQSDTMHRIVGFSQANSAPEEIDWDAEAGKPIYGDPQPAEMCLANNYVVETLPVVNKDIAEGANTSEGASIALKDITREFLISIGYKYGEDVSSPWSNRGEASDMTLWYEGGLLMFNTSSVEIMEDSACSLKLILAGGNLADTESMKLTFSEEGIASLGEIGMDNGIADIYVMGKKEGTTTLTATVNGKSASVTIKVLKKVSGIESVSTERGSLKYDGRTVSAEGSRIAVYNTSGVSLLTGVNRVDMSTLSKGIYIVTATDDDGRRSSLKVTR